MTPGRILGFIIGPIGSALIGLVTVPAVAWIFTPADVGRLNVFQVAVSFALLLSVLGLDQAYVREFHETETRHRLLISCFLPGFFLLALGVIGALFFSETIASFLYGIAEESLAWLTFLAFLMAYVSRFLSLILRMQERGWAYSASQVLPKFMLLILIPGVPFFGFKADFRILQGIAVVGLLAVLLVYGWNTRDEWRVALRHRIDTRELGKLLSFGLPLVLSGLAYWGLMATSTLALRRWSSLEELAVYSVTSSFAGVAVIFQSIFATIWAPTVYRWVAEGVDMRRVDDVARHALVVACLLMIFVGAFSWVADFLLPAHYRAVKYLLACAIVPSLLYTLSEVTTVGIGISRRTGWTVWITFVALSVNVLLSYWWVRVYGAAGAVLANGIAFLVFFILRTEISRLLWRKFPRMKIYLIVFFLLGAASMIVVVKLSSPFAYLVWWLLVSFVAARSLYQEVQDLGLLLRRNHLFR